MEKRSENSSLVLSSIPEEYKKEYLGEGNNAKCYLTTNGDVFKEFKYNMPYYDDIVKMSKYKSDILVYPDFLVYLDSIDEKNLKGYLMKYIKGDILANLKDSVSILKYINELKKLEEESFDLSNEKIILYCLHGGNAYWTKDNELKVADIEDNEFDYEKVDYDVYKQNIIEISNTFIPPVVKETKFKDDKLSEYYFYSAYYGTLKPSYFLNEVLYAIEKEKKEKIETLGDMKSGLKLILK